MVAVVAYHAFIKQRNTVRDRLLSPVDISSLVFFRISFGVLLMWEMWRYWRASLRWGFTTG